jgi:hypothetical protein
VNLHVIDIEELFEVIEKTPNFLEQVEELYEINRVNGRLSRAEREIAQRVLQLSRVSPALKCPCLQASATNTGTRIRAGWAFHSGHTSKPEQY